MQKIPFSGQEQQLLQQRIFPLLAVQAQKYLAGDSTSLPAETAEELLKSLLYTLRLALASDGLPDKALLTGDLDALLQQGRCLLQEKKARAQRLWEQACLTAPKIANTCYRDTLTDFRQFFRRYDPWYFAHQIPCRIDYPLCLPVSEELLGVSYVGQWLQQAWVENLLLSRFAPDAVARLLMEQMPDDRDAPLNLCEQALVNAAGRSLLGLPPGSLQLSDEACGQLQRLLSKSGDPTEKLVGAAAAAAQAMRVPAGAKAYFCAVAGGAAPRLRAALAAGSVRGFFLP